MKVDVKNWENETVGELELPAGVDVEIKAYGAR